MGEPVKLLTRPGLADGELLGQLQSWMNERYEQEINDGPRRLMGKSVRLQARHGRPYSGEIGRVTGAVMCLDDRELFRYEVTLLMGEKVAGLAAADFHEWEFKSKEVPPAERAASGSTVMTPAGPLCRFKIGERNLGSDEEAVGRRVRVVDATRAPGTFLKEGVVSKVFIGGSSRQFHVRLNCGNTYSFGENEVRLL